MRSVPYDDETASSDPEPSLIDRWQAVPGGKCNHEIAMRYKREVRQDQQAAVWNAREGFKGSFDFGSGFDEGWHQLDGKRVRQIL